MSKGVKILIAVIAILAVGSGVLLYAPFGPKVIQWLADRFKVAAGSVIKVVTLIFQISLSAMIIFLGVALFPVMTVVSVLVFALAAFMLYRAWMNFRGSYDPGKIN